MLEGGINVGPSGVVSCGELVWIGKGEEGTVIDDVDLL